MNEIKLPARPDPDGVLTIRVIGHDVEVNAYRDSTMEAYARAAVEADRAQRKPLTHRQLLSIVVAYEQGVGEGRAGREARNPYGPKWQCDAAWQIGFDEGAGQVRLEAKRAHGIKGE